jgi:Zn finger protein HypA/HybF involved in hydrogenase expression
MLMDVQNVPWLEKWQPIIKDLIPRKMVSSLKTMIAKQRRQPSKTLRDIVVCPSCKEEVKWEDKIIYCSHCDTDYPIVGGIPRLILET